MTVRTDLTGSFLFKSKFQVLNCKIPCTPHHFFRVLSFRFSIIVKSYAHLIGCPNVCDVTKKAAALHDTPHRNVAVCRWGCCGLGGCGQMGMLEQETDVTHLLSDVGDGRSGVRGVTPHVLHKILQEWEVRDHIVLLRHKQKAIASNNKKKKECCTHCTPVKQAEGNNIKQTKKNVVSSFVVKKEN
jgi:hypothetical protein